MIHFRVNNGPAEPSMGFVVVHKKQNHTTRYAKEMGQLMLWQPICDNHAMTCCCTTLEILQNICRTTAPQKQNQATISPTHNVIRHALSRYINKVLQ